MAFLQAPRRSGDDTAKKRPPHHLHGLTYPPLLVGNDDVCEIPLYRGAAAAAVATAAACDGVDHLTHSTDDGCPQPTQADGLITNGQQNRSSKALTSTVPSLKQRRVTVASGSGAAPLPPPPPVRRHQSAVSRRPTAASPRQQTGLTSVSTKASSAREKTGHGTAKKRSASSGATKQRKQTGSVRRRSSTPPSTHLLTPPEAVEVLSRFVRARIILRGTLSVSGALMRRVREEKLRDERLSELRVDCAKRTLARFFSEAAANFSRRRRRLQRLAISDSSAYHSTVEGERKPAAARSGTVKNGTVASPGTSPTSLLAAGRRYDAERQVIEAAVLARHSTIIVRCLRALCTFRQSVRVIEDAWRRSTRYRDLSIAATWRRAQHLLARQETLERRDLVRRHLLYLIRTHQEFYNHPTTLAAGLATRRDGLSRFIESCRDDANAQYTETSTGIAVSLEAAPARQLQQHESVPAGNADGGGGSPSCGAAAFIRALDEEAEIRRYERRLFFSKEERELLHELQLLDAEPEEIKQRRVVSDDPEGEAAAWLDNAEQVKRFDRILRGMVAASSDPRKACRRNYPYCQAAPRAPSRRGHSLPFSADDSGVSAAPSVTFSSPAPSERSSCFAGGSVRLGWSEHGRSFMRSAGGSTRGSATTKASTRAARMCSIAADAERARIPFLLISTLKAQGYLEFTPQAEGGTAVVSERFRERKNSGLTEGTSDDDDGDFSSESDVDLSFEEPYRKSVRRVQLRRGRKVVADTSTAVVVGGGGEDVTAATAEEAPCTRGPRSVGARVVTGAVPVPVACRLSPLYDNYTTVVSSRRVVRVGPSADEASEGLKGWDAKEGVAGAGVVPIGETIAALKISGQCDWITESYLNPHARHMNVATRPRTENQPSLRKVSTEEVAQAINSGGDALPQEGEEKNGAADQAPGRAPLCTASCGVRSRRDGGNEVLLCDLFVAAFTSTSQNSRAS